MVASAEEHDARALVDHAVLAESIGIETAMISAHLHPWRAGRCARLRLTSARG